MMIIIIITLLQYFVLHYDNLKTYFSLKDRNIFDIQYSFMYMDVSGFGGLGVACWPLVPKFAGSNPAEAVGFLGAKKSSARLPSEGK